VGRNASQLEEVVRSEDRYRLRPVLRHECGENVLLNDPATGRTWKTPVLIDQALALCKSGASLASHAASVSRRFGLSAEELPAVHSFLQNCVLNGLLLSDRELLDSVPRPFKRSAKAISTIAIPTRGKRTSVCLAVRSQLENASKFGHKTKALVTLDAEDSIVRDELLIGLSGIAEAFPDYPIYLCGARERESLVAKLSSYVGVDASLLRFGLCGNRGFTTSVGSCRNTILLQTAGEMALSFDDDTACRTALTGNVNVLSLFPEHHDEYFFVSPQADQNEETGLIRWEEADFLGSHERVLGRSIAECVADFGKQVSLGDFPPFLGPCDLGETTVLTTQPGLVGDCARSSTWFFLYGGRAARAEWEKGNEKFVQTIRSRRVAQGSRSFCVRSGMDLMSFAYGFDNSEMLPPFMPVLRGQDQIFGTLLLCYSGVQATVPIAVQHESPEARAYWSSGIDTAVRVTFSQVFAEGLRGLLGDRATRSITSLRSIGIQLVDVSQDETKFLSWTGSVGVRIADRQSDLLGRVYSEIENKSSEFGRQVERAMLIAEKRCSASESQAGKEVREDIGREVDFVTARNLVTRFGELLRVWSDVMQGARELKEAERLPAFRVTA
jgi:hypothetical protein